MYLSCSKTYKAIAPAKINLLLSVDKKKDNTDKHPVLNIMHTILLHDVLYFDIDKNEKFSVTSEFLDTGTLEEIPDIPSEDNLTTKAIKLIAHEFKLNEKIKISIYIEKNIPCGAGLGGGSSDCAAAVVFMCKLFDIDVYNEKIIKVVKKLGADVLFFLYGGCGLYSGYGDVLENKIAPINREIILVMPKTNADDKKLSTLSTKDVYKQFDLLPHKNIDFDKLYSKLKEIQFADNILLFNSLTKPANSLDSEIAKIQKWSKDKLGDKSVLLCGSGSCSFGFIPTGASSDKIVKEARSKGWWATTSSLANVSSRLVNV